MSEEQETKKPDTTEKEQKKDTKFQPGVSGNPAGRPVGSVSIIAEAKRVLRNDPERLKEIVEDLLDNKKLRLELIRQIDGMPKQSHEVSGEIKAPLTTIIINPVKKQKSNDTSE